MACLVVLPQVVPTAGVTKDAEWTFGFLEAAAKQLGDGVVDRCRGVAMDGTSTNRKAMKMLEAEYPRMVNLVCAAHSLDLLIKDLGNGSKNQAKHTTCGATLLAAKDLAAAVGESEKLRAIVQKHQLERYKKVC
jgi:hypothetical protein